MVARLPSIAWISSGIGPRRFYPGASRRLATASLAKRGNLHLGKFGKCGKRIHGRVDPGVVLRFGGEPVGARLVRDAEGWFTYVGRADDLFKAPDYRIPNWPNTSRG